MYRAVVMDDEKWTLRGICRTFDWAAENFDPPFATTNPEEGLEYILTTPPDAVFVDILMPEMSGLDLMAAARKNGVASEFIIISGVQEFEYARTALKYAAFDYLLKPLHKEAAQAVLHKLRQHLDSQKNSARLSAPLEEVHRRLLETISSQSEDPSVDTFSQLVYYVEEHLSEPLLLKDVAAQFYLTPNYVSTLFRERLNTTYSEYLSHLRIEKAKKLLLNTSRSVSAYATIFRESSPSPLLWRTSSVTPLKAAPWSRWTGNWISSKNTFPLLTSALTTVSRFNLTSCRKPPPASSPR